LFREAIPQIKVGYIRVTHPCATLMKSKLSNPVRLACIRPAASVHPEPGSNSPLYNVRLTSLTLLSQSKLLLIESVICLVSSLVHWFICSLVLLPNPHHPSLITLTCYSLYRSLLS